MMYTIIVQREHGQSPGREKGRKMKEMTKEEMQRFLNREAEKGSTEQEALKALADILGIKFPRIEKEKAE